MVGLMEVFLYFYIYNLIKNKNMTLKKKEQKKINKKKKLFGYKHRGFWQCMDTIRDKIYLSNLIKKKNNFRWLK